MPGDGSSCGCINCVSTARFSSLSPYTVEHYCSAGQKYVMTTLLIQSNNAFPDKFIVYEKPNCQTTTYYSNFSQVTPTSCTNFNNYQFSTGTSRLYFEFPCIDSELCTCSVAFRIAGKCYNQKERTFVEALPTSEQSLVDIDSTDDQPEKSSHIRRIKL
jgi:hypothetical protein